MKYFLFFFGLFFYHKATSQVFKIGSIEIYGNRKTDTSIIYSHISLKEGDSISFENLKTKKEEISAALTKIQGIKYANVNPVCCDEHGNIMLFIGIGENDSVILKFRQAPAQNIKLPDEMINTYHKLDSLFMIGIQKGEPTENDSNGYALNNFLPAKNEQKKFIGYAVSQLPLIINVLKNSRNAEQRAVAAQIIAYANDKKKVADYLLYAADDSDEDVRNNATRALAILIAYAESHQELNINIPATLFIKMMNSIVWSDRNKGASVLLQLTQNRNVKLLHEIKQKALPSIIEMAKWRDRSHATYAFVILGRIAGIEDKLIFEKSASPDYIKFADEMAEKCNH